MLDKALNKDRGQGHEPNNLSVRDAELVELRHSYRCDVERLSRHSRQTLQEVMTTKNAEIDQLTSELGGIKHQIALAQREVKAVRSAHVTLKHSLDKHLSETLGNINHVTSTLSVRDAELVELRHSYRCDVERLSRHSRQTLQEVMTTKNAEIDQLTSELGGIKHQIALAQREVKAVRNAHVTLKHSLDKHLSETLGNINHVTSTVGLSFLAVCSQYRMHLTEEGVIDVECVREVRV
ncbi:hypothetical protein EGW08_000272 [Elysia chlorotica]|uniref:Uncharacterized protein n=1 Tax=Elysia chlorotica TaxID=188477 RepID=A0A433UE43_ELYCH|nr:hypothetical protein EGW08_000272 [Elysia chlorotica]